MSDKFNRQNKAKRQRDATIQRYVRERDQALDDLKKFTREVNAHVGTAYNILAASLGYEQGPDRKYLTEGRDLITLVLEIVKKRQDADPTAPKIVEQRTAPVEYEEKQRVVLAATEESKAIDLSQNTFRAEVEEYEREHPKSKKLAGMSDEEAEASYQSEIRTPSVDDGFKKDGVTLNRETLYEALEDIATADEREAIVAEEGDASFNPAAFETYKDAHTHGTFEEPLSGPDSDSWDDDPNDSVNNPASFGAIEFDDDIPDVGGHPRLP